MLSLAIKLLDFLSGGKLRLGFAVLSLVGMVLAQILPKDNAWYGWVFSLTTAFSAFIPNAKPTLQKLEAKLSEASLAPPPATDTPQAAPGDMKVDGHSEESAQAYQDSLFKP